MNIPNGALWVRFPRFIGDAVMIHLAIAPLRAARLPLVAWGPEWLVDLFEGSEDYCAVQADPVRNYSPFQAARLLRKHRSAAVINFPKSLRPLLAAFFARIPKRVGCADGGGVIFCTHSVRYFARTDHFVDRYRSAVAKAFPQLPLPPFRPFRPRPEALEEADRELQRLGGGSYVIFAPGANSYSKRLDSSCFIELGQRLNAEGLRVVLIGAGAEDHRLAEELKRALPGLIDRVGAQGLAASAAWIARSRGLVGGDSGMSHLAGAMGIPTLVVFGPTRPEYSAPEGPLVKVITRQELACLGCLEWHCPLDGHPCMTRFTGDELWGELNPLLERSVSEI